MAMIGKVRRMHRRQNKTVREIARETSQSRNTVRKYLRMPLAVATPPLADPGRYDRLRASESAAEADHA